MWVEFGIESNRIFTKGSKKNIFNDGATMTENIIFSEHEDKN